MLLRVERLTGHRLSTIIKRIREMWDRPPGLSFRYAEEDRPGGLSHFPNSIGSNGGWTEGNSRLLLGGVAAPAIPLEQP